MRILIVHQHYLIPGQPGGSRFNEMARFWADAGHEVEVIAGTLNYATGETPRRYRGKLLTRELDGKVVVWRSHVPSTYSRSYVGRAWAFLGFTFSASLAALRASPADVVIATSPPLTTVIPGWIAARRGGATTPWVFEIRDLWPESAVTTGVLRRNSLLTRILYLLERWACGHADRVNVLTPAFREDIIQRNLVSPDRIDFIPNGAEIDRFKPGPRDNDVRQEFGWRDRFVVMYSGAHGKANAVGQLVDAAEKLRDRPDILIACVGDGPERLRHEEEARRKGLQNIIFHRAQPKDRMPDVVNACDVGAAVLQNNPTFRTVYPNKVFDYMACGRPTLLAIDGVARKMVCEDANAGLFVEPENADQIASAIRRFADSPAMCKEMGESGRRWVELNASREGLAQRYLDILNKMASGRRTSGAQAAIKFVLDRLAAVVGLVVLSPLLLVLALLVWLTMGRPIFFTQTRPGFRGRPFRLIKFRTMRQGTQPDRDRMTLIGRFLRSTSFDELPELWNVLKGDMSLVGPRPLLMKYMELYTPEQARRHDVRPGITGWAQVNGRNAITWERRFEFDVWYVDHQSFWFDMKILLKTIWAVLTRQGVSAPGHPTMEEFQGSPPKKA